MEVKLSYNALFRLVENGNNQYTFEFSGIEFDGLNREDLFTISVLIQKVLSGIEE
jgi:hypothetical protein